MRILFVSGVAVGGSARSTRELALGLARHGHTVGALFQVERAPGLRRLHKRTINLTVRLGSSPLARPASRAASLVGRHARRTSDDPMLQTWETILPENSFPAVARSFRPDVVVASSIDRMSWRSIRARVRADCIPSVLYVREQNAFGHLTISQAPPDRIVTNAHTHTVTAAELGFDAATVPSLVTVDDCIVESTRTHVLLVNPTELYGVETAFALAEARPDLSFAFSESSPIAPEEWQRLEERVARLPNVELRHFVADPRTLYRDARVLLAPYRTNGRPRVVLEAQANGIPVLGSTESAVSEAVGPGGVVVDVDAPTVEWTRALGELVDDPDRYERYATAARQHSARPDVDTDSIIRRFEQVLEDLVASSRDAPPAA
jgi:hypothetical protein